jgi:hypothetical protein
MAKPLVSGWKLPAPDRARLLARVAPLFPDVIADHVTLQVGSDAPLPRETGGDVVGVADDGQGVQALVVRIGGTTARPDGSTYHITWSLDRAQGRRAKESNDVIAACGWRPLEPPEPIALQPACF